MRIKTVLQICILTALLTVLGSVAANWVMSAKLAAVSRAQERAQTVARDVTQLLVLSHDYFLYAEERSAQQWRSLHASIVGILEAGRADAVPVPPESVVEVTKLPEIFQQLVTADSSHGGLRGRQKQLLFDQLLMGTQVLADSVHGWNHASADYRDKIERETRSFTTVTFFVELLTLFFISMLIYRRVLRPLSSLHQAVQAVANGDLTGRCATTTNDEFGALSRTFDAMAVDLVSDLRREISAHMQTEQALRKSNAFLQNLIDHANAPIIVWDPELRITRFNHAFESLSGRSEAEVLGQSLEILFPPLHAARSMELIRNASTGERWETVEIKILHRDESERTVEWNSATLFALDGQTPIATIAQGNDITVRKQFESKLQEKNAELERFAYTVSHDLKSPLITIQSYAGMIANDLAAGKHKRARDDLMRIEGAADKMTALLADLLLLSRAGRVMDELAEVDMNRLVMDVRMQLAGSVSEGQVEVVVQPDLPPVFGDCRRIAEVVQNLLENAIKYMGDRAAPRIEIGTRHEGNEPVFFVKDNGKGIAPRFHETIFGLFNKLDVGSDGTGVGLALVKTIVEAHGGRVWVESDGEGMGSCFCFTLPLGVRGEG